MNEVLDIPEQLTEIQNWVLEGLASVADCIEATLASDIPAVASLCRHVERFRGKMLRPTLVLVSGAAAGTSIHASPPEELVRLAAVVEMVHMATLVHDDVLDDAEIRRQARTINSQAGNETAVLLGDYLIAASFRLCASLDDPEPSRIIGRVSMELCAGELLQLSNRDNLSLDEATYFQILEGKTASLVGACTMLGARVGGGGDRIQHAMDRFGRKVGVAFQVQDDLLDLLGTESVVGKTLGRDLKKGKLTLPMIHHLASQPIESRGRSLAMFESASESSGAVATEPVSVREALVDSGSIEYAKTVAADLVAQAKQSLADLPTGPARSVLELLADAVLTRHK
ncbi:MAG TPA: polyprenyl synthetase family protein [Phycisphaerales bacterium]|nr:polyprenyl synthetase family protein [Phycisphaerales bacterium]